MYEWDEGSKSFVWAGEAPEPVIGQTKEEYADYAQDYGEGAVYQASVLETLGLESYADLTIPAGGPGISQVSDIGGGQGAPLSLLALLFLG
ncbi:hypothetical protein LCGC14_1615920 [marine sediment metagenome]|uniref:Uncharacterized protein n=1 Tax=marine sediment metagenome TaxID=412755 RepID=A0A0F9I769_9ZZZZ